MCNGVITSGRNHWFIMFNSLSLHTSLGSLGANLLWWGFYWNNVLGNQQTDFLINISMCLNVRAGCALKCEWMVKPLAVSGCLACWRTQFSSYLIFFPLFDELVWGQWLCQLNAETSFTIPLRWFVSTGKKKRFCWTWREITNCSYYFILTTFWRRIFVFNTCIVLVFSHTQNASNLLTLQASICS